MAGGMLCTVLRCRRRLQFWFLLGLKARLHTGQSNSCVVVGTGVMDMLDEDDEDDDEEDDDDVEDDKRDIAETDASDMDPR